MLLLFDFPYNIASLIYEPVTTLTDLLLAFSCFYFFFSIQKIEVNVIFINHWQKFFLFLGVSTLLGAIAHSIFEKEKSTVYDSVWISMQIFAGLSIFYAQAAAFRQLRNPKHRRLFLSLSLVQLLIFIPSIFYFFDFRVVALNSFIALVQLVIVFFPKNFENWIYKTYISFGFFISFLTVYVHNQKLSFSKWFNHNDISHLIMYLSILLIFRGIKYQCKSDDNLQTHNG